MTIRGIQIDFAVDVELTPEQDRALDEWVNSVCKSNTPAGYTHWPFGSGYGQMKHSLADRAMLGPDNMTHKADASIVDEQEPEWEPDGVLHIETACREKHQGEK